MKLYLKTIALVLWVLNVFILIGSPLLWVYALILDESERFMNFFEWVLGVGNDFSDIFWVVPLGVISSAFFLYPLFYFFIVGFYWMSTENLFVFLSFSWLKTAVFLSQDEVFYKKLFHVFEELFPNGSFNNKEGNYKLSYSSQEKTIFIDFTESTLKSTLRFVLDEQGNVRIKNPKQRSLSNFLELKEHDTKMYHRYYRSLLEQLEKVERKQKEKEAQQVAKKEARKAMANQKEAQQKEAIFDQILSNILLMKKRRMSFSVLELAEDTYTIELQKKTVIVLKNKKDVWIKCAIITNEPVIYLHGQTEESKEYQKLETFYRNLVAKNERIL